MVQEFNRRYPELRPFVKHIQVLENSCSPGRPQSFHCFADGCPGLIFHQSDSGIMLNGHGYPSASVFLYGQTVKPVQIVAAGRFRMIIVFLHPHAVVPLLGTRADELVDTCLDLSRMPVASGDILLNSLLEASSTATQIDRITSFLLHRLRINYSQSDQLLTVAVNRILDTGGGISLGELHQTLRVSERTFERRFEQYIGIPPRLFARICRFQATLQQIRQGQYDKLSDVAFDQGYADQSHFIRSFKEFTGLSPLKFQQHTGSDAPRIALVD